VLQAEAGRGALLRSVPDEVDRLLSVEDAARQLNVSTATVYKLCASGKLRSIRILNTLRIARRDLGILIGSTE
jgi:excisionase family DNA binding protein